VSEKPLKAIAHAGRKMEHSIVVAASPEEVYRAWADPEKISQWFTDQAEGRAEPGAKVTWVFEKFNYRIPYEVVAAEAGKRLAVRWVPSPGRPPGVLEVTIESQGGSTLVRLVNSGFLEGAEWQNEFDGVESGGDGFLGHGREPGRRAFFGGSVDIRVIADAVAQGAIHTVRAAGHGGMSPAQNARKRNIPVARLEKAMCAGAQLVRCRQLGRPVDE